MSISHSKELNHFLYELNQNFKPVLDLLKITLNTLIAGLHEVLVLVS